MHWFPYTWLSTCHFFMLLPPISAKALYFRAVHPPRLSVRPPSVRSFYRLYSDRSCYHDISWKAWAVSIKFIQRILTSPTGDLIRFWRSKVKGQRSRPSRWRRCPHRRQSPSSSLTKFSQDQLFLTRFLVLVDLAILSRWGYTQGRWSSLP